MVTRASLLVVSVSLTVDIPTIKFDCVFISYRRPPSTVYTIIQPPPTFAYHTEEFSLGIGWLSTSFSVFNFFEKGYSNTFLRLLSKSLHRLGVGWFRSWYWSIRVCNIFLINFLWNRYNFKDYLHWLGFIHQKKAIWIQLTAAVVLNSY